MSKKNIKATFYKTEPLGNDSLELVGWSGNHWDNISFFPKNYQIGFIKKGRGQFFAGDNIFPISEGQIFLIHPGKVHSGKPDKNNGWTVDTIVIKRKLVEELFNPNVNIIFPGFVVSDDNLKKLFLQSLDLLNNFENTLENEGKLYMLLTDLLKLKAIVLQNDEIRENQNEAIDRAS